MFSRNFIWEKVKDRFAYCFFRLSSEEPRCSFVQRENSVFAVYHEDEVTCVLNKSTVLLLRFSEAVLRFPAFGDVLKGFSGAYDVTFKIFDGPCGKMQPFSFVTQRWEIIRGLIRISPKWGPAATSRVSLKNLSCTPI